MASIGNMNINIIRDSSDHKGMPLEVEVEYYGVKQTFKGDAIKDALKLFLVSESSSLTPEELIDKVRVLDKNTIHQTQQTQTQQTQQTQQQPVQQTQQTQQTTQRTETNTVNETKENHRFKVTGIGKKLLAFIAAGVMLATGHFVASSAVKRARLEEEKLRNDTSTEEQVTAQPIDTTFTTPEPVVITPEPAIVTPEPEPEIVYTTPIPVEGNDVIAPPVPIDGSENLPYVNGAKESDWITMSDADYLEALNSQSIACQMNMPEISIFLEGGELEGSKQLTNIQKTFKPGSVEYCIVEHFNQERNEVVNAAYDTRSVENTKLVLDYNLTELFLFSTNQKSVVLDTPSGVHEYWWNDLSEEAKNSLLDIMFGYTIALPHGYSVNINGQYMLPENFAEFYEAQLSFLTLVNPTNKR